MKTKYIGVIEIPREEIEEQRKYLKQYKKQTALKEMFREFFTERIMKEQKLIKKGIVSEKQ